MFRLAVRVVVVIAWLGVWVPAADADEGRGLEAFERDLEAFVEVLGHPEEARIFAGLETPAQRERFLHRFWAARGVASWNEDDAPRAFERARRLYLRFLEARRSSARLGDDLRTDRARAYLLAGAPARIVAFGGCRGIVRPLRLWWYDVHQARDLAGEATTTGFWLVFRRDYAHSPGIFRSWWPGDEVTELCEDDAPFPRSRVEQILALSRTGHCFRKGESEARVVEEALRSAWPLSRLERMARSRLGVDAGASWLEPFADELLADYLLAEDGLRSSARAPAADLTFHPGLRLGLRAAGRAAGGVRPETAVRARFEVPASLLRRVSLGVGDGPSQGIFDRWTVRGEVRKGRSVVDSFEHVFHVLGPAETAVLDVWRRVPVGPHTVALRLEDAAGRAFLRASRFVDVPRMEETARVPEEHRLGLAGLSRDEVMTLVGTAPRATAEAAPPVGPRPASLQLAVRRSPEGARAEVRFRPPEDAAGVELASLEIFVDDRRVASLPAAGQALPPGAVEVDLGDAVHPLTTFVRAAAVASDGQRLEDHVFLRGDGVESVDVRLVEVYATVLDRRDHPVVGLGAEDLRLREDGRVQTLERFDVVENLPLRVALLMDTSTSMRERLPVAVASARRFFGTVVRAGDRAALLTFDHDLRLETPWTGDVSRLALGAAGLEAEGGTRLHDAVVWALGAFAFEEPGTPGQSPSRRALVVLSDGADVSSDTPFERALEAAVDAGVAVYPILLPSGRRAGRRSGAHSGGGSLVRLARESGGRAFRIDEVDDLDWVYDRIEEELRSQYLLVYASPGERDGRFRRIEVEALRQGLEVRAVRGYWR